MSGIPTVRCVTSDDDNSLDQVTGFVALGTVVLAALELFFTDRWHGQASGMSMWTPYARSATAVSALLLMLVLATTTLYLYRLADYPSEAGGKNELTALMTGIAALWTSDFTSMVFKRFRRKRRVAEMLAAFPTFRVNRPNKSSPIKNHPQLQEDTLHLQAQLVVRSANPKISPFFLGQPDFFRGWVRGLLPPKNGQKRESRVATKLSQFDPGSVWTTLLYDGRAQDEAGAELLTAEFTHASVVHELQVGRAVWAAVSSSMPWLVLDDAERFKWENWVKEVKGVYDKLRRPSFQHMNVRDTEPVHVIHSGQSIAPSCSRMLWATIVDEILAYLRCDRRIDSMPVFEALCSAPLLAHEQCQEHKKNSSTSKVWLETWREKMEDVLNVCVGNRVQHLQTMPP